MNKLLEQVGDILFVNLEVVRQQESLKDLSSYQSENWNELYKKSSFLSETFKDSYESFEQRGSLYAEYGKIVALHMAYFNEVESLNKLHSKVFVGSEKEILNNFFKTASSFERLCSYDGKRFDFPYLIKRLLINNIPLPKLLKTQGKKPWEIMNIDTSELWQNGNSYHSPVGLVAPSLGISFTNYLSGEKVSEYYFNQISNKSDYNLIESKCEEEGIANIKVWLRLSNVNYELKDDDILKL